MVGPFSSYRTACYWSLSLSLLTLSHCGGRCCSSASRAHPRRGYWVVACAISHPTRRELTPNACMSIAVLDTTLFNPLGRRDRRPFPKPRGGFCCFGVSAFAGSLGIASERVVYSTCHVPACTLVRSWSRHQTVNKVAETSGTSGTFCYRILRNTCASRRHSPRAHPLCRRGPGCAADVPQLDTPRCVSSTTMHQPAGTTGGPWAIDGYCPGFTRGLHAGRTSHWC